MEMRSMSVCKDLNMMRPNKKNGADIVKKTTKIKNYRLTAGIIKKLVTIFARHLDSFIMTPNLSAIYQFRKAGSGQFFEPGQVYLSPGFAKLRHGVLPAGTSHWLKYLDGGRLDCATNAFCSYPQPLWASLKG